MRSAVTLTEQTDSNVTLHEPAAPYANMDIMCGGGQAASELTGLNPRKMQFELSEAQNLSRKGIEKSQLPPMMAVGLLLANSAPAIAISICCGRCTSTAWS